MTADEKKELWRWAVYNRIFDLRSALGNIRSTMKALGGINAVCFNDWNVAERQLRVTELEVENLRRAVSQINYEPKDPPCDTSA